MRLDLNCVRDILICVEENVTYEHGVEFYDPFSKYVGELGLDNGMPKCNEPLFEKYGAETLLYHLNYCFKDKLIEEDDMALEPYIGVQDLTPHGHEVINDIREKTVFEKVKFVAKELGLGSMLSLREIVSHTSKNLIYDYFKS